MVTVMDPVCFGRIGWGGSAMTTGLPEQVFGLPAVLLGSTGNHN